MTPLRHHRAAVPLLVAALTVSVGLAGSADGAGREPAKMTPFAANLTGVAAVSADSAWAVGYQTDGNDVFLDYWDGTSWAPQDHPAADSSAAFLGVSASSATDVWAVGSHYIGPKGGKDSGTYVQHYDGSEWSVVKAPNPGRNITVMSAVSARTPSDAWAVGFQTATASSPGLPLIEHWDGTKWKSIEAPKIEAGCFAGLTGVTALSASEVWAVGTKSCDGYSVTLIDHWDGQKWRTVPSPNPGGKTFNLLNTVSALSPTDVWAVGAYNDDGATAALALRWDGHKWRVVSTPDGNKPSCSTRGSSLIGVSGHGKDLWAVGGRFCGDDIATLVLRWNGTAWKVSPSPSPHQTEPAFAELTAVSAVSPRAAFALGNTDVGSGGSAGFIQRWNGSRWTLQKAQLPRPSPLPHAS